MSTETAWQPGDHAWVERDHNLGAPAGMAVTVESGPDEHGMYRVQAVLHGYVSADDLRTVPDR